MTGGPREPALHLTADLRVDVDGVPARVSGDGPRLIVDTEHPLRLVRAAARGPRAAGLGSRRSAGLVGEALAGRGVSIVLRGPRGPVATVGAAADSALGEFVAGSRRVGVATPYVRRAALVAASSLAAVVLWRVTRRRGVR